MSDQIRRIWDEFDRLIAEAPTPEAKSNLQGLKLLAELANARLAPLEMLLSRALQNPPTFQTRV